MQRIIEALTNHILTNSAVTRLFGPFGDEALFLFAIVGDYF